MSHIRHPAAQPSSYDFILRIRLINVIREHVQASRPFSRFYSGVRRPYPGLVISKKRADPKSLSSFRCIVFS
ncbi:MAG: hypothetical protein A4E45_00137 [Methanosaeta sp. PtaB.Bin039]|nr:MAG: hypothetical protein A4E45_00137 [Methanosaeta sp. PtaB.Bin039]OPY47442.1 MAG: hypothetical protein A4E47_00280 [Methanosaeta sp. PtaU1.Bin028]